MIAHVRYIQNYNNYYIRVVLTIQLQAFVRDTQQLLSSLAVYVEQARLDENQRVSDENRSLANDIRRIEESGIYQILCTLQVAVAASNLDLSWDPTVARGVMLLGCRSFRTQAPVDNRNYMIFYTLEKLLHRIGNETLVFRTRRDWPDGSKKRGSSADEDMESQAADVGAAAEAFGEQLRPGNILMFVQPEKTSDFEHGTDREDANEDPATCNNMQIH